MKKLASLFFGLFWVINITNSQIKVASNNNIGIGTDTPLSKLSVGNSGNTSSKVYFENNVVSGSSIRTLQVYQPAPTTAGAWAYSTMSSIQVSTAGYKHVGLYSSAYPSTAISGARTFGTMTLAGNGETGCNYGLYAGIVGTKNGTAILAVVPGKTDLVVPGMYAAYFRGKVYVEDNVGIKNTDPQYSLDVTGSINFTGNAYCNGSLVLTSDISRKTDIKNLEPGSLEKIKLLNSVTYKYTIPEDLISKMAALALGDTGIIEKPLDLPNRELYDADQIGFIAQDLQKVFPQLVLENKEGTLGVNYIGLIPVLVDAIKEQQAEIEELKTKLNNLVPVEKP
jgi:hypothetical protein